MYPDGSPVERPFPGGMGGGQGGMNKPHWYRPELNEPQPIGEYISNDTWAPPQFGVEGGGGWGTPRTADFRDSNNNGVDDRDEGGGNQLGPWQPGGGGRPEHTYWPQPGGGDFQARPTQPGGGWFGGLRPHRPPIDRWAGLGRGFSQDQFWKAKAFADRGKMGRAKQAIMQGGGQWSPQLRGLLSSPSGRWGNMGWNTMA
jgi:hypothetical protein